MSTTVQPETSDDNEYFEEDSKTETKEQIRRFSDFGTICKKQYMMSKASLSIYTYAESS